LSGAKGEDITKPAELFPESLVWAIVTVFVAGLGATIGLMAVMKQVLDFKGVIIAFTLLSFLLMLVVEGVFIWMLLGRKRGAKEVGDTARLKEHAMKELGAAQALGLPEPAPSVTEHTTREFEPIYSEPKSE
jgi:hypothetical protein